MVDEAEDCHAGGFGDGHQRFEGPSDFSVDVGVEFVGEPGHERVEDEEGGVGVGGGLLEFVDVVGEGEAEVDVFVVVAGFGAVDEVEVGAVGHEPGDDGVGPGVFGGADEDGPGGVLVFAGEGRLG